MTQPGGERTDQPVDEPIDEQADEHVDGRVVILVTSPRVAPGLLSWPAWEALTEAGTVLAAGLEPGWPEALADAGVTVEDLADVPVAERAGRLLEASDGGRTVVWLGSPDGDPGLTDALAEHLTRRAVAARPPEVELLTGSHDVPGSRLLDLVAVMDTLRSPGGCPWDAEQTHESLLPYLLEESHEVMEAVELGDRAHLREELGDLLLQVAFHARVAQEHPDEPFGIDEVAAGIVAKLVSRHPHVFGDVDAGTADEVERNWETIKAAEKQRTGVFEGIPAALPALARAQKMLGRVEKQRPAAAADVEPDAGTPQGRVAADLLAVVRAARAEGVDAEAALRAALNQAVARVDGPAG
ncbi:MazG family protein [Kineosporia sp. R_H_3]|uniref:MazG family protein n=1 Tax=Kineosporia sp. R_H_3 TaxID=1961848 RepID=UPI001E618B76|nr:MazG family protein [Kineosporia sp. R_H_3]